VNDVFLGVIAIAVLVMAVVQVTVVVIALRATRQIGHTMTRLEQDLRPIVSNLHAITAEAARATAMATAQVERADRLFAELSGRLEQTIVSVQTTVAGAARGSTWLAALRAVIAALRDLRAPSARRPSHAEEEDALFIG
jgi:hypothetical protein